MTLPAPLLAPLPGEVSVERLDNGLTVGVLRNRQAPVVTSVLWLRAGTRDEPAGHGGIAHFLEHMMFKGSARYGPGEIDRRTQALGGSNNAFTNHDGTAYYFRFAADRWPEALAVEADRMAGLTLDPAAVESERRVILEEIAMYEADPWESLHQAVETALYGEHPYGRPVLGTRAELLATGSEELAAFHRRRYRPDNAVLVLAGDLGDDAEERVVAALGRLPAGAPRREVPAPPPALSGVSRLVRRRGDVARLIVALPGPPAGHPDHAALAMAVELLSAGRSSRLQRALVEEGQLCVGVSAGVSGGLTAGAVTFAAELLPGVEPVRVEERLFAEIGTLVSAAGIEPGELARVRRMAAADWVFEHERVHQQALATAFDLAFFELGHSRREMERGLAAGGERLLEVAGRYLRPQRGAVVGWSLPYGVGPEATSAGLEVAAAPAGAGGVAS